MSANVGRVIASPWHTQIPFGSPGGGKVLRLIMPTLVLVAEKSIDIPLRIICVLSIPGVALSFGVEENCIGDATISFRVVVS